MYNSDLPSREELPSTRRLVRSALIALAIALGLLVAVVMPAEYGKDPTGIGSVLGLTEMGEIKQQLADEAEADKPAAGAASEVEVLAEIVPEIDVPAPDDEVDEAPENDWSDEVSLEIAPGVAVELKLIMKAGAVAEFEWIAEPGHLHSALHGDGNQGQGVTYRNGRAEVGHSGKLVAEFDGSHGWFWRNRSDETVTLTLRTKGDYSEVKRVL